jgi:hypothetical protein
MKIGICSRDFQPKDRGRVRLGYVRRKTRLTAGPGHQRHRRERERERGRSSGPAHAEKRLGPVGPAAKTESRPARVGFHAAGYTGKFFSFVFFSFLIFQTHFQIKFS